MDSVKISAWILALFMVAGCQSGDDKKDDSGKKDAEKQTQKKDEEQQTQKEEEENKTEPKTEAKLKRDADAIALEKEVAQAVKDAGGRVAGNKQDGLIAIDLRDSTIRDEKTMTELLSKFPALPNLQILYANGPTVTAAGLEQIGKCKNLTLLDLFQSNANNEGLTHLAGLSKLQTISLQKTNVTSPGLITLSKVTSLMVMDLRNTNIEDDGLQALAALTKLKSILFGDCLKISNKGLEALTAIEGLEHLGLVGTQWDDKSLELVSRWSNLQTLNLDDSSVTSEGTVHLTKLKKLTSVSLRRCYGIKEATLDHLSELPNLKTVKLRQTSVSNEGLGKLKDHKLELLDLNETGIGNEGMAHLKEMQSLKKLYLWSTFVDAEGLAHLTGLKNLVELDVQQNGYPDEAMEPIGKLVSLEKLILNEAQISDDGLKHLHGLKNLKELSVNNCLMLTEAGIEELQEALPNCKITGPF